MIARKIFLPLGLVNGRIREHQWRGVRFLCYHSVVDRGEVTLLSKRTVAISTDGFSRHMELIRENGYELISMCQALNLLRTGKAQHGQYICLTVDDGRLDNFVNLWPLLRASGYSAHFFINSNFIGKAFHHRLGALHFTERYTDAYMDADAIRTIVHEGGSIGSHAQTHPDLTTLDDATLRRELVESRQTLQDLIGGPITTHAYPYASYDYRVLRATKDAGYRYAFGINTGTVTGIDPRGGTLESLTIPRNVIRGGVDAVENYAILRGGFDLTRTYSEIKFRMKHRMFQPHMKPI